MIFPATLSRRELIKTLTAAGLAVSVTGRLRARDAKRPDWHEGTLRYLKTLNRPDNGYAWGDQTRSHLTPSYAAIGCLQLLEALPADRSSLARYVRTNHPRELKKLEQERRVFEFQQIQALSWLGEGVADFRDKISTITQPATYLKQYEQHGYPIFQSELAMVHCYALTGLAVDGLKATFVPYIVERRRDNGSFNNTPAGDGGDGHVMNTLWALQASRLLGMPDALKDNLVVWLQSCQLPSGGFTYQPDPALGGIDDVAYTRAAVRSLALLGAAPSRPDACIAWLHSLANDDGGFGDRPGWLSNASASYCALDALSQLKRLHSPLKRISQPMKKRPALADSLKVFSIQLESHGQGSPEEAVALAKSLRIDLWGSKNAEPEWLARAQEIATQTNPPVTFFVANEEYNTWLHVPGFGTYSHTSDIISPSPEAAGESLARKGPVTWQQFREQRLTSLHNGNGRLIWQFGENEELVRALLDDSLEKRGFAALSTFHFGNPDFTNTEPFLQRWRGHIPYIALQDAHGKEPWWFSDMTSGFRTLFLGTEPTWDAWMTALSNDWVVAVRHDTASRDETWMHSGSDEVLAFVKAREKSWRWWDNPNVKRPLVSVVAVSPSDKFEVGRPESGVTLRVRCAWNNSPQGLLLRQISEFVSLSVDGTEVKPELVVRKTAKGMTEDHYYSFQVPSGKLGKRVAKATVRSLADGKEQSKTIEFTAA